jgi:DNA-binding GntR family transcriptional regulator
VTIDHESGEPLYMQLAAILRERIRSGDITSRVPSIKTLTQEYGVSHITAESAIDVLKAEDLIYTTVGKGSYVKRRD